LPAIEDSNADVLAEIYDLEHDTVTADVAFYRQMTSRVRGAVLDLGCGSGRLFGAFLDGRASRVVGVDASSAMLQRATARIEGDPRLVAAAATGQLELVHGDVRSVRHRDRFGLIVAAAVRTSTTGGSLSAAGPGGRCYPAACSSSTTSARARSRPMTCHWPWTGSPNPRAEHSRAAAGSHAARPPKGCASSCPRSWTCRTPMVR
jgi:hypothetical protein